MIIRRMDRDGDGRLSWQEFRGPPQRFGLIDSDGDGFVTKEEFSTAPLRRGGGPVGAGGAGGAAPNHRVVPEAPRHPDP